MFNTIGAEESGEFKAVASGALASGKPVVVNADGTVSVVAESSVSQSVGTSASFHSSNTQNIFSSYDASTNRVVVAYSDPGDSDKGKAIVGTVSGTDISFGSEVVFETGSTGGIAAIYDSASEKIVIAFQDYGDSQKGKAIVGTVSGTSISFGSVALFKNSAIGASNIAIAFDSNSNRVVVVYTDSNNSNYGTAKVGTVSGTDISFSGSNDVVYESAQPNWVSITFDSTANKVVISYADTGNSNYGTAIVGTVESAINISFGSAVVFESANTDDTAITFDSSNSKVVILYQDAGNSNYGTAIVGTVSGTGISFGSPVVFEQNTSELFVAAFNTSNNTVTVAYTSGTKGYVIAGTVSGTSISFTTRLLFQNNGVSYITITYNSTEEKSVISYRSSANNYGTSIVYTGAGTSTNITSENFIGMSKGGAVADTENATVDIIGSVNNEQSSLTAGQQYFVQNDGTIGTTADDPSVLAGTAISATKILVKT